jgi:predicted nucleotidyltransferase
MLTKREIDTLIEQIVARIQPQRIIIFGSYAKGTATIKSDLDLFIIKETKLPMRNRADNLTPIFSNYLIPLDVHVYTPEEVEAYGREPLAFVSNVLKFGKVVYHATHK